MITLIVVLFIITNCVNFVLFFNNRKNIEKMENTDDNKITEVINKIYKADVQSIRNLAEISEKLQKGTLSVPGNLTVEGIMSVEGKFNYLPTGSIIAFNGITAPKGWAVCDGTKGTPDLRGRFIRMWNDTGFKQTDAWHGGATIYTVKCKRSSNNKDTLSGNKRGSEKGYIFKHSFGDMAGTDVTTLDKSEMPLHNHGEAGEHNHKYSKAISTERGASKWRKGSPYGAYEKDKITGITLIGGKHTHANEGNNYGHGISNPYHVLTYIMKL